MRYLFMSGPRIVRVVQAPARQAAVRAFHQHTQAQQPQAQQAQAPQAPQQADAPQAQQAQDPQAGGGVVEELITIATIELVIKPAAKGALRILSTATTAFFNRVTSSGPGSTGDGLAIAFQGILLPRDDFKMPYKETWNLESRREFQRTMERLLPGAETDIAKDFVRIVLVNNIAWDTNGHAFPREVISLIAEQVNILNSPLIFSNSPEAVEQLTALERQIILRFQALGEEGRAGRQLHTYFAQNTWLRLEVYYPPLDHHRAHMD
jgi:hypothetical protein